MLNKVVLMGRLVRNPELRATSTGVSVATFTLAVEADARGQKGEKLTDFFDITAWRKTAEFASTYLLQGRLVVVAGRLKTDTWEDNTGKRQKKVSIVAENIYFADSKKENAVPGGYSNTAAPAGVTGNYRRQAPAQLSMPDEFTELGAVDDDLPF